MRKARLISWVIIIAALFGHGCLRTIGPTTRTLATIQGPRGVVIEMRTNQRAMTGELIAIRDEGLVVLASQQLTLVPFQAIRVANFEQLGQPYSLRDGRPPDTVVRERLRLASRYPQGLSPEVLAAFLQALGQAELTQVEP